MAYKWVNFRITPGYVSDDAGDTYNTNELYPITRNGQTFGWVTAPTSRRDITTLFSAHLAGNVSANASQDFRLDLPDGPGKYRFKMAMSSHASVNASARVSDSGDASVFTTIPLIAITSAQAVDILGAVTTKTAWDVAKGDYLEVDVTGSHVLVRRDTAGGFLYLSAFGYEFQPPVTPVLSSGTRRNTMHNRTDIKGSEVLIAGSGGSVTARGVVYHTSASPTLANSVVTNGSGLGVYDVQITGLAASTLYYWRAYATNASGTSYGTEGSFTTTVAPSATLPIAQMLGIVHGAGSTLKTNGELGVQFDVVDALFTVEIAARHIGGITGVAFSLTDGSTTVTGTTQTATSLSSYASTYYQQALRTYVGAITNNTNVRTEVYKATINPSTLTDGQVTLTVTVTAADTTTKTLEWKLYNNAGGTKTVTEKWCGPAGNDTTGDGTSGFPYLTISKAIEQAATTANAAVNTAGVTNVIPFVTCLPGTYQRPSFAASPYPENNTWVTVRSSTGVASDVIIRAHVSSGQTRIRLLRFRNVTIDISDTIGGTGTDAYTFLNGWTNYTIAGGNPDALWVDGVTLTHVLGRNGQLSGSDAKLSGTTLAIEPYYSRCLLTDMKTKGIAVTSSWSRDIKIFEVQSDLVVSPIVAWEHWWEDNANPPDRVSMTVVNGAITAGDTMYYAGASAVVVSYSNGTVVISTDTIQDFKGADSDVGAVEFYSPGDVPTVDTPVGTGTAGFAHPDGLQNTSLVDVTGQVFGNIIGFNLSGQILFHQPSNNNIWWSNFLGVAKSLDNNFNSSAGATVEHFVIEHVSLPNQRFLTSTTRLNSITRNCIAQSLDNDFASTSGLTFEGCHQITNGGFGDITDPFSSGEVNWVNGIIGSADDNPTARDYSLTVSASIRGLITSPVRKYDGAGIAVGATDSAGFLAYAGVIPTWQAISGATAKTLTILNVQAGDYGRQFRFVATGIGTATSNTVEITAP